MPCDRRQLTFQRAQVWQDAAGVHSVTQRASSAMPASYHLFCGLQKRHGKHLAMDTDLTVSWTCDGDLEETI